MLNYIENEQQSVADVQKQTPEIYIDFLNGDICALADGHATKIELSPKLYPLLTQVLASKDNIIQSNKTWIEGADNSFVQSVRRLNSTFAENQLPLKLTCISRQSKYYLSYDGQNQKESEVGLQKIWNQSMKMRIRQQEYQSKPVSELLMRRFA